MSITTNILYCMSLQSDKTWILFYGAIIKRLIVSHGTINLILSFFKISFYLKVGYFHFN